MSRFYGPIGFVASVEDPEGSGIWVDSPTEKNYRGEITRNTKRWDSSRQLNDNLEISNTLSIVADPYASSNLYAIRYVKWLGSYWKVTSAEVSYPRLILSLGGVYNGPTVESSSDTGEYPRFT